MQYKENNLSVIIRKHLFCVLTTECSVRVSVKQQQTGYFLERTVTSITKITTNINTAKEDTKEYTKYSVTTLNNTNTNRDVNLKLLVVLLF